MRQVCDTCRSRLWDLYWVSTTICRSPEFRRFDSAKSMSRYCPPNGTAGLARSSVRGMSRLPSPPARTMPNTLRVDMPTSVVRRGAIAGVRSPTMSDAAALALPHARRPAHPRVPARGLRRCGRARRGTRPGAAARHRGRGALLRRSARRGGNVRATRRPPSSTGATPRSATMGVDLLIAGDAAGADLVHSHTWYANFAGFTAKRLHGIPHVVTAHSLEPLRPWKAEQLGGGYRLSSWVERTAFEDADAVIAVSDGHAPRHPALLSVDRPGTCAGRLQRHRPRRLEARTTTPTPRAPSASIPTARR